LETVRALADRGVLASDNGGRLHPVGELGDLDVPATLSSLLAARLDGLDPDEREVVKAMAVFGGSFPRSAAAALTEVPDERLDDALAALRRAANRTQSVGAPDAAERLYLLARELASSEDERTELTEAAGDMAMLVGRYGVAIELLDAAAAGHAAAGREAQ